MNTVIADGIEYEIVWTGERIITAPVIPPQDERPVVAVIRCAQCGADVPIKNLAFRTLTKFCSRSCSQLRWRLNQRSSQVAA